MTILRWFLLIYVIKVFIHRVFEKLVLILWQFSLKWFQSLATTKNSFFPMVIFYILRDGTIHLFGSCLFFVDFDLIVNDIFIGLLPSKLFHEKSRSNQTFFSFLPRACFLTTAKKWNEHMLTWMMVSCALFHNFLFRCWMLFAAQKNFPSDTCALGALVSRSLSFALVMFQYG